MKVDTLTIRNGVSSGYAVTERFDVYGGSAVSCTLGPRCIGSVDNPYPAAPGEATAITTKVIGGGHLYVGSRGIINDTTLLFGSSSFAPAYCSIKRGGIANNTKVDGGRFYVTGTANYTTISDSFETIIYGVANYTTMEGGGRMCDYIASGGVANHTSMIWGYLTVSSGGIANDTTIDKGLLTVCSGGTAVEVVENGGYVDVQDGATVTFLPNVFSDKELLSATIHSGTTAVRPTIKGGYSYKTEVYFGGTATDVSMISGELYIHSGGTATNIDWDPSKCRVFVDEDACVSFASQYSEVYRYNGSVLSSTKIFESCILGDRDLLSVMCDGKASKINVSSGGRMHVYSGGSAEDINVKKDGSFAVNSGGVVKNLKNTSGTIYICGGAVIENFTNKGSDVTITKGAVIRNYKGTPIAFPDCDRGWNNYVYNKKAAESLNSDIIEQDGLKLTSSVEDILLDSAGEVSFNGKSNYVGYGDELDFTKITLDHAASLSFRADATGAAKITVWSLTESVDKKGGVTYKMKSHQATSLKKDKTTGEYSVTTKSLLLEKGDYYISVQSTNAKKGGNAYYTVELGASTFYEAGDDGWNNYVYDKKAEAPLNPAEFVTTEITSDTTGIQLDLDPADGEWDNFVGFGDAADYAKITLESAAKLSFTLAATDAAKFVVYRLDEGTGKKAGTFTLKSLQSTTLKKAKGATEFTATTKALSLAEGEYFISMQSTNAKKGGAAFYSVELNHALCAGLRDTGIAAAADVSGKDSGLDPAAEQLTGGCGGGLLASL